MRKHLLGAWLVAALMSMLYVLAPAADAATTGAGKVRFVKAAESSFDSYLQNPSALTQAWISGHYARMRAYSGFFDSRTSWYTNAWAYKDAYAIYRGQEGGQEQWILKDSAGRRLYIPFACSGGVCPQYAADIGNPGWRRRWIDDAKRLVAKGYRGIFVDDVNMAFKVSDGSGALKAPIDPRTGSTMTHDAWQRYFAEFMEQLRAELPAGAEIVQNQVYFHVGLSSAHVRRAIAAATHVEFERGFNDTGIRGGSGKWGYDTVAAWIDFAHSRGKGVIYDVQASWGREYALANYFLFANGMDGIGMDQGGLPNNWWSGWETELGAPRGERFKWNNVWRRDFEHGTVLVNPPDASTRTLELPGAWKGLDGSTRTGATLSAREGAVLLRKQAPPPAPAPVPSPAPSPTAAPKPPTPRPTPCRPRRCRPRNVRVALDLKAATRTAVVRGAVRARSARRARVSLQRKVRGRWVAMRRATTPVSRGGRFRSAFGNLRPGTYRAVVKLPAGATASRAVSV